MAQQCTIYCKSLRLSGAAEVALALFGKIELEGERDHWDRLIVSGPAGRLRLSVTLFRRSGDEFSRLRLSTYLFIDNVPQKDEGAKLAVLAHVEATELIMGVVAEPALDADDRFGRLIFEIAARLDGLIFTGNEMLNASGDTSLDLGRK